MYVFPSEASACPWQCLHGITFPAKRTVRGGSIQYVRQCKQCGDVIGSPVAKNKFSADELQRMPSFSDALYESGRKLGAKLAEEKRKKENEEWHETYEQYLASSAWKEKRRLVMLRAQGICEGCRTNFATVVHHLTYKRVMREMLFDLVALCEDCHSDCHADGPEHE